MKNASLPITPKKSFRRFVNPEIRAVIICRPKRLLEIASRPKLAVMTNENTADNTVSTVQLLSPFMAAASILIVDDEVGMRNFLTKTLAPHCAKVEEATTAAEATIKLDKTRFDIVILDDLMPGQTGIEWLTEQRKIGFFGEAILITAYADMDTAIAALRAGAIDFLLKPFRANQILSAIARCLDRTALRHENTLLRHELAIGRNILTGRDNLIGNSDAMKQVKDTLRRCAKLDSNVLIKGETGTGKEVAARMLHANSDRAGKAFVPVTCAAFPDEHFNSVLFGSLPENSDTGQASDGLFLSAEGGVLFLDDVDQLSTFAQAALVQVIETGKIRPVNATRDIPVDVRIIASCAGNLLEQVQNGRFREDLYYRLNVLNLDMPALRQRPDDIIDLAKLFIDNIAADLRMKPPEINAAARRKLLRNPWPGNVRELRNHIERALIHGDLEYGLEFDGDDRSGETLAAAEKRLILDTLEASGGNRAEAARRLGVSRKTIDRKCQAWKL